MTNVLNRIATALLKRGETLAVAESVTSGNIQALLSLAEDATRFFQGGVVAYNLGQKTRQLDIDPIVAQDANCVSQRIADNLALHVAQRFCADWGIAITGYAAPIPELGIEKLFAFYTVARKGKVVLSKKLSCRNLGIARVQQFYTRQILHDFNDFLSSTKASTLSK